MSRRAATRAATAGGLALALAGAPSAGAAPVCRLVSDVANDQRIQPASPGNGVPGTDVDVRSADLAVDDRHVVAEVRLGSFQRFDPDSPQGRRYDVTFTVDRARFTMSAFVTVDAVSGSITREDTFASFPATVSLDPATARVRIHARVKDFGIRALTRGGQLGQIGVLAGYHLGYAGGTTNVGPAFVTSGPYGVAVQADEATTTRTYRAGTPTCVAMPG